MTRSRRKPAHFPARDQVRRPPAVARVRSPADLAACVPELLGFHAAESLVVLALREPHGRLGLTMRMDLAPLDDPPGSGDLRCDCLLDGGEEGCQALSCLDRSGPERSVRDELLDTVVTGLQRDGATSAAVVVLTDEADWHDELPRSDLVGELCCVLDAAGFPVVEALLVRAGRWWSYLCRGECCPRSGQDVDAGRGPAGLIAAERVLAGEVVLGSRAELAAQLDPVLPLGAAPRRAAFEAAADALADELRRDGAAAEAAAVARVRAALVDPERLSEEEGAACTAALWLPSVRQAAVSWATSDAAAVRRFGTVLCRAMPAPQVAPALLVAGAGAYLDGNGALARVALERCASIDPGLTLAGLLLTALDQQLPPRELKAALRQAGGRSETRHGPPRAERGAGRKRRAG